MNCPNCGQRMQPELAQVCGPGRHSTRLITGWHCVSEECQRAAAAVQRIREDELIADAVRRGVVNP